MARAPTANRYARALFELASERNAEEAWLDHLRSAQAALADPTVSLYLRTPRVRIEQKLDVVKQIAAGADPLVANLLCLLTSRSALPSLPAIVTAYGEFLNESLGRAQAQVTSAVALAPEQQTRLSGLLHQMLDKEVVLEVREDPEIIGGVIVRVGDQVIDGSIRTRLALMRQRLGQAAPA